jgi:hypothetical protein
MHASLEKAERLTGDDKVQSARVAMARKMYEETAEALANVRDK